MKKLLLVATCACLLTACSATKNGYEVYGNGNGGWNDAVNITDLDATKYTKEFRSETEDVVYFNLNSATLDAVAKGDLKGQVAWLKANPQALVVIEGRCDERGTREYNLALGARRANAAKAVLVNDGVESSRISTISYGKERPLVKGSGEDAWKFNRNATTTVK